MATELKDKYRRMTDEPAKLLILLNERVENMTKAVEKLIDKQAEAPCKTHALRIKYLEKAMWVVLSAIVLLIGRLMYSLIVI
jgi:hypothetical protein